MKKTTRTSKVTTVVNFILDESGSMEPIKEATIAGFNKYLKGLKQQKEKFLFTLTKFDSTGLRTPYLMTDVKKVEPLDNVTYSPGANTPLYDAVVETVEKVAAEITGDQAVLVAIMSDGEENSSVKHDEKCLQELIQKLEKRGNWTFVFMGANQDSWATASNWGIAKGNIANWQATRQGTGEVFGIMAMSTSNFSQTMQDNAAKGVALNASNFFDNTKK